MSDDERLRAQPSERFDHPLMEFDLDEEIETIQEEDIGEEHTERGHRRKQLYRHDNLTLNLLVFEEGGSIPEHNVPDGSVVIQVLEGRLRLETETGTREIGSGELVTLKPGVHHEPTALETSKVLLTIVRHSTEET